LHELSIAVSLVEAAVEKAATLGNVRVSALRLRIGPLSGVVKDALLFCFELAAQGTPIEGATLVVEEVPITAFCPQCGVERELPGPFKLCCPGCGTPLPRLLTGKDLELSALEVEEDAATHR